MSRFFRILALHKWAYLFIAPAMISFCVFTAYPILYSVVAAFYAYSPKDAAGAAIQPTQTTGTVRFYLPEKSTKSLEIPKGTTVSDGKVSFQTTQKATIAPNSNDVLVTVEAMHTGSSGDVAAETITHISHSPDARLKCTNPFAFVGGGEPQFVGLMHFKNLLAGKEEEDRLFLDSLRISLIYALSSVGITTLIALLLALLITNLPAKAETFYKSAFYLPTISSEVVMALIWAWMLLPTESGLLNGVIAQVAQWFGSNAEPVNWLGDPNIALFAVILPACIGTWGPSIIMYLSNIRAIPKSIFEAADLDGFSGWKRAWHVTLPLIMPAITFNLIMGIIGAMQVFGSIYILTRGGPVHATTTSVFLIYETGFTQNLRLGRASAMAIILFVIIFTITVLINKRLKQNYEFD
jgi:multiple sugar transport system permease protein